MTASREFTNLTSAQLIEYGFGAYDGVILAYLPKLDGVLQEHYGREYTLYSLDGVAYDCMPPMKWWKVREAARVNKLALVEPIWSGAVCDFRVPNVPRPADHKLFVRGFSGGPWICLEDELEKETNGNSDAGSSESAGS